MDANPVDVQAAELVDALRRQFVAQGELAPSDGHLLALARVAAGFLRTSPLPDAATGEARRLAVQAFVTAALGWWVRERGEYGRVAGLLDDVFRQRETPVPDGDAMEMLLAVAVGLLRQRRVPPHANGAQLALADWLASVYLAGLEDW